MATCRTTYQGHHEGWGPVSTFREFDLTPCFEEGIVLSTLLVVLLVVSLFRLWGIKSKALERIHTLTSRSALVLNAKLVRSVVVLPISMEEVFSDPDHFTSCKYRSSSGPHFLLAWQTSSTSCSAISTSRSFSSTSSNRSPYFLQSSSLTPTITEPGLLPQPFCCSGPHIQSPCSFGGALSSLSILRTLAISSFLSPSDQPLLYLDSSRSHSN